MAPVTLAAVLLACPARAQLYTHVDPVNGNVTLSNLPPKGMREASREDVGGARGGKQKTAGKHLGERGDATAGRSFPAVDPDEQLRRDGERRQILVAELEAELKALARAVDAGAGQEALHRHRSNILALEREIGSFKVR